MPISQVAGVNINPDNVKFLVPRWISKHLTMVGFVTGMEVAGIENINISLLQTMKTSIYKV